MEDYKKKYENALSQAKQAIDNILDKSLAKLLHNIFPELKESEDLKIKRDIQYAVRCAYGDNSNNTNSIFAWLEKQGEVHPIFRVGDYIKNKKTNDKVLIEQLDVKSKTYYYTSYDGTAEIHSDFLFSKQDEWELIGQKIVEQKTDDKVEPKFKVGDWVRAISSGNIFKILSVNDGLYHVLCYDGVEANYPIEVEKDLAYWTIQDAKDGDVLVASDGSIFIFKEVVDCGCKHRIALTKDNETINVNDNLEHYWETSRAVHPATKEQRKKLEKAITAAGYKWNKEDLKLEKI